MGSILVNLHCMGSILVKVNQMDSIPDIRTCKGKWDEQLTCKSTLDVQQLVNTMDCLVNL